MCAVGHSPALSLSLSLSLSLLLALALSLAHSAHVRVCMYVCVFVQASSVDASKRRTTVKVQANDWVDKLQLANKR